ncbi:MAG: molybdenum ABC transporter ATP-binding protein [Proteobacteria bacterium]|nr:molybdenum ABC transporter ATP-binding protein [Pseudomonadota bacterium]
MAIDIRLSRNDFSLRFDAALQLEGITAVFGPSGAGKTTLLRVVAGLEKGAVGRVALGGDLWQDTDRRVMVPAHARHLGYVFQDGRLFPHLSVEGNLLFAAERSRRQSRSGHAGQGGRGGRGREVGVRAASERSISSVVQALDLKDLLGRKPDTLSGGEIQRVAMGRALLTAPRVMLLDEPLSALDVRRKAEIIPYVERLAGDFGVPVLYVTHNVDEVARLASSMVLLADGRMAAMGGVAEILERVELWPITGRLEAGSLLEAIAGVTRDGMTSLDMGGETLRVPALGVGAGTPVHLRVQAREVAIARERPERLSIRNVLPAKLVSIEFTESPFVELLLDVHGQHLRSRVTREAVVDLGLREGQAVFALIKSVVFEGRLLN